MASKDSKAAPGGALDERPLVSVVVPCFNEEETLPLLYDVVTDAFAKRDDVRLELVFINDGSSDGTAKVLQGFAGRDGRVTVISLSRNFGHQPAISAGLEYARGDAVIISDADLQDTPEAMMRMIDRWLQGDADVIYGVRSRRKESLPMRAGYFLFYRLLRLLAEIRIPVDSGDFGLMDRKVVDAVNALPERNRFVRGLRAWVGYSQVALSYERGARAAGRSKYSLGRLFRMAFHGLFDFSVKPLTAIFYLGLAASLLSIGGFMFFLLHRIIGFEVFGHAPSDVPGFTTLVLAILFLGSVQLLAVGLLGEYIGRLYEEAKRRPSFLVKAVTRGGDVQQTDQAERDQAAE